MREPAQPEAEELGRRVVAMCIDAGFDRAGIASLEPLESAGHLQAWLGAGKHGEMQWLADTAEKRFDPGSLLEGASAAVMVADQYHWPGEIDEHGPLPMHGRVARYAQADDYHTRIKKRLIAVCDALKAEFPGSYSRVFADTAPVAERELARRAGLGWTGKHTLAIDPEHGSWFVLGGFLTTLDVRALDSQPVTTDHCGTCTRCIDACPTGAISPYSVDAARCVSYLTIEHRSTIAPQLAEGIGAWFAGCDVCQEVCPHNRPRDATPDSPPEGVRTGFDLLDVLGWDEATRRARFAGSALKRISLAQAHRNAAINAANLMRTGGLDAEQQRNLRAALERLAWNAEASDTAREAARRAIAMIE